MVFVPTEINIGKMKINNADHLGTISFGSALEINRNVCAKKTQGIGQQFADRCFRFDTISLVLDDDIADLSSKKLNKS
ncbi:hypothetical protein [Paenibacillus hamazuiensis]|uniref:hypothetical protein n=1 Tax=Paenibacillus hamazuiensis TaxID=2936508 RepID=UPI0020103F9E|nr:hypothetical protein [Paenibacillus hamazuiensis]